MGTTPVPPLTRFWAKVDTEGECWNWTAGVFHDGYPAFQAESKKTYRGHRWLWTQENGPIPEGLVVRHKCDNRRCVRMDHLELGTPNDNVRDRETRNRTSKGETHRSAKLTDAQVTEIREAYMYTLLTQKELAARYGVSRSHIGNLITYTARNPGTTDPQE